MPRKRNGHGSSPDPGAVGQGVPPLLVDGLAGGAAEPPPDIPIKAIVADLAGESTDTLTLYLREVRRTELFTPQEEFETATRARAGDFAARQSMIEHNLRRWSASPRPTWGGACRCPT
jgi:RNA polymerase nonessential primary-like sigma factor